MCIGGCISTRDLRVQSLLNVQVRMHVKVDKKRAYKTIALSLAKESENEWPHEYLYAYIYTHIYIYKRNINDDSRKNLFNTTKWKSGKFVCKLQLLIQEGKVIFHIERDVIKLCVSMYLLPFEKRELNRFTLKDMSSTSNIHYIYIFNVCIYTLTENTTEAKKNYFTIKFHIVCVTNWILFQTRQAVENNKNCWNNKIDEWCK